MQDIGDAAILVMVVVEEVVNVGPYFRFARAVVVGEDSDDRPVATAEVELRGWAERGKLRDEFAAYCPFAGAGNRPMSGGQIGRASCRERV